MRIAVGAAVVLVLAAVGIAKDEPSAELDHSADDLICRFGPWDACDGWLAANRHALFPGSRRATPVAPGAKRLEDAAARGRARDALVAALTSRDPAVASEAALALGFAGDARDIATLAGIVRDAGASRRMMRWAALGLGMLPIGDAAQSDEARKALLGGLAASIGRRNRFVCFWSNCGYALAMRGDGAAAPALLDLHGKATATRSDQGWTHDEVVGAMCLALGAVAGEDAVPELEAQLKGWQQRAIEDVGDGNWAAVAALSRVGGEKAVSLLRNAASDPREDVRCLALHALGLAVGASDEPAAKLLRDSVLLDRDAACRQMAAVGLARSGHASAGAALATALERGQPLDRRFFAVALALRLRAAPDAKLSDVLAKALARTGSQEERAALAIACGLAGVEKARADIVDSIPKSRAGLPASAACFALGFLGAGPAEKKILHEVVAQSVDPTARREAALALGMLHDHSVVDDLRAVLKSKSADHDRASAAMCLGHVGDDADIDALVAVVAERTTSDPLRACVIHGLGRLLDRDEGARLSRLVAGGRWLPLTLWIDPIADPRALLE